MLFLMKVCFLSLVQNSAIYFISHSIFFSSHPLTTSPLALSPSKISSNLKYLLLTTHMSIKLFSFSYLYSRLETKFLPNLKIYNSGPIEWVTSFYVFVSKLWNSFSFTCTTLTIFSFKIRLYYSRLLNYSYTQEYVSRLTS